MTDKVKGLTFKNYQLRLLYDWLSSEKDKPLLLHGKQARSRNKFFALIEPQVNSVDEERIKIATEYSKTKDGKPELDENNSFVFPKEGLDKFNKEYNEVLNEDFTIDILPSNKETLKEIKEIVLNIDRGFDTNEGKVYDLVCQTFEKL